MFFPVTPTTIESFKSPILFRMLTFFIDYQRFFLEISTTTDFFECSVFLNINVFYMNLCSFILFLYDVIWFHNVLHDF